MLPVFFSHVPNPPCPSRMAQRQHVASLRVAARVLGRPVVWFAAPEQLTYIGVPSRAPPE